ncbi:hypothetical protein [Helicobacter kayseriensis]|uniref:hypothetical protein n=1 Tax=Helicobacter kayseriensis TaxID=2905877 RepID=UPI001E2CC2FD|nr:hypothetical protein [Helicobacter kayseriensis]MCE3047561.1 hypothetical protein [Helicobacter kayseriensis]MCE3048883.1 hypothetical protein [Helicobacter kayseriensis]
MEELILQCKELGLGSRIVRSALEIKMKEVEEIGGESLEEFHHLNQKEEMGIDRWLRLAKGREYDGDEVMLELLLEIYKKLEHIQQQISPTPTSLLHLEQSSLTCYIGHEFLCLKEKMQEGKMYYARVDLPSFPNKLIPFYLKMLTPNIARIIKMGEMHTRSYDSYIVECERLEIRSKKEERL